MSSRRPTWSIITFGEIEAYRAARKIPKRRMAEFLGVTNSTYHNWASGKAVPTRNAQRKLLSALTQKTQTAAAAPSGELLQAVSSIVSTYLRTCKRKVSADEVVGLVTATRTALGA